MKNKLENILKNAKSCVFLTSAGMSAESGIPTFRDKDGYWRNFPAFKEKGLDAIELASPDSFHRQPEHSWAFYEWRRRNARENTPHEGYHIINRLIEDFFESSFIHTTNTDGYHLISGADEEKVYEIHGSMWRLQCLRGHSCGYGYEPNEEVPLCELDYDTMIATDMPSCPICGSLLRPHILMFGDFSYLEHPFQPEYWQDFIRKTGSPDLALLIGSSGSVPTNDYIAEQLQRHGTTIITINPDIRATRVVRPDLFLEMGAKDALLLIEETAFN